MRGTRDLLPLAAVGLLVALAGACSNGATKGTVPPGAAAGSGMPDFIAVAGRDGEIAGYTPKDCVLPAPTITVGRPQTPTCPVYAEDLHTLVGSMVPDRGFVPVGVDPATVPTFQTSVGPSAAASETPGVLTLYVRSAMTSTEWFAIIPEGEAVSAHAMGAGGFNTGLGVGCFDRALGDRLVLLDRAPQDPGAAIVRVIFTRQAADEAPVLWADIGVSGAVSEGLGVPAWWPGGPQVC